MLSRIPVKDDASAIKLMASIAPEREIELQEVIRKRNVTFQFCDNEEKLVFRAYPFMGVIQIQTKCILRLWATAYGHFKVYNKIADFKTIGFSQSTIDLKSQADLEPARRLLTWATGVDCMIKKASLEKLFPTPLPEPYPANAPEPFCLYNQWGSDEHVADELTLVALAFILHHELAHIRLSHSETGQSDLDRVIEKEADQQAASWVLGSLTDEVDDRFIKRILGVVIGLGWLASHTAYIPETDQDSVPPAYDRLFQVVEKFVTDPSHVAWAMTAVILALHMQNNNIDTDANRHFESFKDACDFYVDVLAERNRPS